MFSEEEILRFHDCNFENAKALKRNVHFFNSLWTTKISAIFKLSNSCCPSLKTSQNNLNYASTLNIGEIMKFYNLGNKTFETDFRIELYKFWLYDEIVCLNSH